MDFSVIIPAKNEEANIERCLQSIKDAAIDSVSYELLLLDNGSTDATVSIAKRLGATVIVQPDATISALRNQGARAATGSILCFIDADCTVASNWFEKASAYLDKPEIRCFGSPPGVPADATWVQFAWYQVRQKPQGVELTEWLESMNLFVRKDAFESVGGFDESLVTCEDYDFCLRIAPDTGVLSDGAVSAIHHGEARNIPHFYSKERWRGVSNLAGVLRHGLTWSELPSLVMPIVQLGACVLAVLLVAGMLGGAVPVGVFVVFLLLWQLPLGVLSARKSRTSGRLSVWAQVLILINIYLVARGHSMLSHAGWRS